MTNVHEPSPSADDVFPGLAELARALVGDPTGPLTADRLVEAAATALSPAQGCAVTYITSGSRPRTLASTGELPPLVDRLQYATGEGPCLDALGDRAVELPDMATEDRWPKFARRCLEETDVRSMLSVQLVLEGDNWAALNFYSDRAHCFDDDDVAMACAFAPFIALSVQSILERRRAENLDIALENCRHIGSAIGILMAHRRITSEEAFAQLRRASQCLNRKLRDVAADVELTGTLPDEVDGR